MSDELNEFVEPIATCSPEQDRSKATVVRELLVFAYEDDVYAVPASGVEGVVPWKTPTPVPGGESRVHGVIQDRGRIVVVMAHPTGQANADQRTEARRIIICSTPRGHVGLPATTTNAVGPVELPSEPSAASVYDSDMGPFTYLDPSRYSG
jgi:chemotaxis signal transduction protein